MDSLEFLLQTYVEYNPQRVYSLGDFALRYHGSYRSVCLYKAKVSGATGAFAKSDWDVEICHKTAPPSLDLGVKAPYLGNCVSNIVYKSRLNPERYVPGLPRLSDVFFDNWTHI